MSKPYTIEEEGLSGACARLVELMKKNEPGLGEYKATCHDGSTIEIKIEVKKRRARRGVETERGAFTVPGKRA